jgi:hypothetical protein
VLQLQDEDDGRDAAEYGSENGNTHVGKSYVVSGFSRT